VKRGGKEGEGVIQLFGRMLAWRSGAASQSASHSHSVTSEMSAIDIEDYYLRIISESLRRLLVPADGVEVRIKRSGRDGRGRPGYAGCVRITRWDPLVTPVLLQNMPVVDARVRKLVQTSIILQQTYFAGLWFQATSTTQGAPESLMGLPAELVHQPGWAAG
jgi:hypothetical protein